MSSEPLRISALYTRWLHDENSNDKEAVKIFLADETTTPFYLKKVKKQIFTQESLEREQKRTEFLCNRDNCKSTNKSTKEVKNINNKVNLISPREIKLSPREQEIEDTLFGPYRNNDTAYSRLLQKVKAYKTKSLKVINDGNLGNINKISLTAEEKFERVLLHKKKLELEKEQSNLELVEKIKKDSERGGKVEKHMMNKSYKNVKRTEQFLTIIRIFSFASHFQMKINKLRILKETNKLQWKAALIIQRYYFKYYDERHKKFKRNKRGTLAMRNEMALQKLKEIKSKIGAKELYVARVNACTVITEWLSHLSKTFQSAIKAYIIKIKGLQRCVKRHLTANSCRINYLSLVFDRLIQYLMPIFDVIISGKGYDVIHKMSATEVNFVNRKCSSSDKLRVIVESQTSQFHKFLRNNIGTLCLVSKLFPNQKIVFDPNMKRSLLLNLIFSKRKMSINHTLTKQQALTIPFFSVDQVKDFITGNGADPLKVILETKQKKEDDEFAEYQRQIVEDRLRSRRLSNVAKKKERQTSSLLLLQLVQPEDLMEIFFNLINYTLENRLSPSKNLGEKCSPYDEEIIDNAPNGAACEIKDLDVQDSYNSNIKPFSNNSTTPQPPALGTNPSKKKFSRKSLVNSYNEMS